MIYNRIDISARVDRGQEAIYRRVGLSFYMIDRNGKLTHSPFNVWTQFFGKGVNTTFKMDYTIEVVANKFKGLFGYALKSTGKVGNILDFDFNGYSVLVENRGGSLLVNGSTMTRTTAARHLSALCFQTKDDNTREEVRDKFFKIVSLPPDVNYAIINRAPYSFYHNGKYIECRLNVQQISSKEVAIEISEGLWGTLTVKQFLGYLSHYLHGTQRGSWCYIPEKLYERIMGEAGRDSDIKVMKNFLGQNRTSAIVNERAEILLKETLEKYGDRVKHFFYEVKEDGFKGLETRHILFVKGTENDWAITWIDVKHRDNRKGRQLVSTKFHQSPEEAKVAKLGAVYDFRNGDTGFMGVCVDNLQSNSPLIDQAVSRVLVCLNDKNTKKMVSTMQGISRNKRYSIDFNSFQQDGEKISFQYLEIPIEKEIEMVK